MSTTGEDTGDRGGRDLDADVRRFVEAIGRATAGSGDPHSAPHALRRQQAEAARAPWACGGPQMAQSRDLEAPIRTGRVALRLHRPILEPAPGLVYLHGGGWTMFSLDTHDRVMREYAARSGCAVIGVDYALSPEARYPAALRQVIDVVRWLRAEGARLGIDPARLAIGGDSAGANLAIAACLSLRDAGEPTAVRSMLLNYGAYSTDCTLEACRRYGGAGYMLSCEEMAQFWRDYLGSDADARDPLACPLLADLRKLPAAFVAIAECDILAEQNVAMAEKLQRAGVPVRAVVYRGASHSFLEAVSISALSERALAEASSWLRGTLAAQPEPGA